MTDTIIKRNEKTNVFLPYRIIKNILSMRPTMGSVISLGCSLSLIPIFAQTERSEIFTHSTAHLPQLLHLEEKKEESSPWAGCLQGGWASKYVSEGIDNWEKGGLWMVNPELRYENFTFSPWYGVSDSYNAKELQLVASYDFIIDALTISPFYEHDFVYPEDENASNPGISASYQWNDRYCSGVNAQWLAAHGKAKGYYELWTEAHFELHEDWELTLTVLYGFNEGYVEDVNYGSNTMDYAAELIWQCSDKISFSGSVHYSQALTVLKAADLGNEFWFGLNVHYFF